MPPCLLALDTSTDQITAALLTPGGEWRVNAPGGALASTRLIPALMGLLAQGGITVAQLHAIAFGQGPGAFTGLRTACAVAQGLAFASDTPVLAIDSLLIVADDARHQAVAQGAAPAEPPGPWWVAMDARMDEVYAACYQHGADGWQVQVPPQLWTLAALSAAWLASPPVQVAGSAITVFADRLPWGHAHTWPRCSNRAAALGRLAQAAWAQGKALNADQALPVYLRDKVALTTAERAALRQAADGPARLRAVAEGPATLRAGADEPAPLCAGADGPAPLCAPVGQSGTA